MFDDFSKRSKAVQAALDLAKERSWGDITLADIARAANLSLADLRREFTCKSDILRAFQAELDAEVLARAKPAGETQTPRDRLFDVVMTRFEAMQPYKPALKRIASYLCCRPGEAAAASRLLARLAILDARSGRRQARRPGRRATRRGARRHLRQGVSACGSTTTRPRSTRPWPRSTSGSAGANACSPASRRRAAISAAVPAGSCRAVGNARKSARRRLRPVLGRHRRLALKLSPCPTSRSPLEGGAHAPVGAWRGEGKTRLRDPA